MKRRNALPYCIGLTGGIASGKSTVARLFAELGATVIDADQVSRDLVLPGTPALAAIHEHFGAAVITAAGDLDRRALRTRIFQDPREKDWLERLLHPRIRAEIDRRLHAATGPYAILEVPLLLESGEYGFVDRVLVVDLPEALQVERALMRDKSTREEIEAIIASQISRAARLRRADDVIDNSQDPQQVERAVEKLHEFYKQQAREGRHPSG